MSNGTSLPLNQMTFLTNGPEGVVSTNNSTSTPLLAGAQFVGTADETTEYASITVVVHSDQASADHGLPMEFSTDNVTWDRAKHVTVIDPSLPGSGGTGTHTLAVITKYFRITYTNGPVDQTEMRLQVIYHKNKDKSLSSFMDQTLTDGTDVNVVRSVIVAKKPSGAYENVAMTEAGTIPVCITGPLTSFGEVSVAEPHQLGGFNFAYNIIHPQLWSSTILNSAPAPTASLGMATIQTGVDAAGYCTLYSRDSYKYHPGIGTLIRFTCVFAAGVANSHQECGFGDDDDGFLFGFNGTAFGIVHRKNGVDAYIAQSSWNTDPCDGTKVIASIDPTMGNVYQIGFQYLGFGAITFSVEDSATGRFEPVHIVQYANSHTTPSIGVPNQVLRMHVHNTGNTANLTMKSASMAVFAEGIPAAPPVHYSLPSPVVASVTTEVVLMAIRNKITFSGHINHVPVCINTIAYGAESRGGILRLYSGATGTGDAFSDHDGTNSVIEESTTTGTISGGELLATFMIPKNGGDTILLDDGHKISVRGGETIHVTAQSVGGTMTDALAILTWTENP